MADHHPVEEHAQRGQPLLHRGSGVLFELGLNKRRHMHRLDLGEIHDVVLGTEGGELPHRLPVGAAGIGVAICKVKKSRIRARASGRTLKTDGREGVGERKMISLMAAD